MADVFWGWGILGFIVACCTVFAFLTTCYRRVIIRREAGEVSLSHRGGFSHQGDYSPLAARTLVWPLSSFTAVRVFRSMVASSDSNSKSPLYTLLLVRGDGGDVPILAHGAGSIVNDEATKLASFLSLPVR